MLLRLERQWGWGVTLPSWTQQGQKERGLRRGVPPLGSTSKRTKQGRGGGDTERHTEEERSVGVERDRGTVKQKQAEDKKHKSEKGATGGKEKNTRSGKAEARETKSTNKLSPFSTWGQINADPARAAPEVHALPGGLRVAPGGAAPPSSSPHRGAVAPGITTQGPFEFWVLGSFLKNTQSPRTGLLASVEQTCCSVCRW